LNLQKKITKKHVLENYSNGKRKKEVEKNTGENHKAIYLLNKVGYNISVPIPSNFISELFI